MRNFINDIFGPIEGKYNFQSINLFEYVKEKKVYKMYIQSDLNGYNRHLVLKHLNITSNDINSFNISYIIIPNEVNIKLKSEFHTKYGEGKIEGNNLFAILHFLLSKFNLVRYNKFPKDQIFHYYFEPNKSEEIRCSSDYTNKVFNAIKNYYDIYYEYSLTEYKHHQEFLKLLIETDWNYEKLQIPKSWQFEIGSRKWEEAFNSFFEIE